MRDLSGCPDGSASACRGEGGPTIRVSRAAGRALIERHGIVARNTFKKQRLAASATGVCWAGAWQVTGVRSARLYGWHGGKVSDAGTAIRLYSYYFFATNLF